jgi:DNA-binding beta-propeller fold protein YncE
MAELGSGEFTYEVSGENWGNLPEDWTYKEATAVAVDAADNVYVFNRGTHPMIVFDPNGNVLRTWGDGVFNNPHGVTIGPDGSVYCVDNGDHTVRKFSAEGKLLMTLGGQHPSPAMSGEPFNLPTHMAVDPRTGDLYVADGYGNARVHKYSPDGRLLNSWGESGTDEGQFNIVHNIITDKEGWLYIADRENQRVQVFSPDGEYETQWVNMSRAACICTDHGKDPLFYVGEYFCGLSSNVKGTNLGPRVTVMDINGTVKARLSDQSYGDDPGRFYAPHGIAVDSTGSIYVAEVSWSEFGQTMEPPREPRSMQKLVRKPA